jgi:hypothetical protein
MESGGKRATVGVVVEVLMRLDREMRGCQENTPEWLQRVSASRWLLDEVDKAGNLLAVVTRFKREVGHTPFLDETHLRSLIAQGCEITQVHKVYTYERI